MISILEGIITFSFYYFFYNGIYSIMQNKYIMVDGGTV